MFIILSLYYLLYLIFLFDIVPINSLFYIRPLGIFLVSLFFLLSGKYLKKGALKILIILLNIGTFFIIKEFSRTSLKTTIILIIISTIILIFILINNSKTKFVGFFFLSITSFLCLWQGQALVYKSNIKDISSNINFNFVNYGNNTDLETSPINLPPYYNGNKGLAGWYDRVYWKLSEGLPLNGRFVVPKGDGKFPIIFIVHGNSLGEQPSHLGYDYLLENFAENGYIAVSIDQNFLNGNWTTLGAGQPEDNDTRGRLIIEHIKLFNNWNNDKNSVLYKKIDMKNIGLVGHSRGGEAISIAAKYSVKFPIKALMVLAGTDRQYDEDIRLKNISFIALQGANDGDIKEFKAISQYNRIKYTTTDYNLKASYYLEGVNHNQFNSDWGYVDSIGPGKIFYGKNSNLRAIDQREIAKGIGLKFFNVTLKKVKSDIEYLKNPELINSLPEINYLTDYYDSTMKNYNINFTIINGNKKSIYKNSTVMTEISFEKMNKIILPNETKGKQIKNINFSIASKELIPINISAKIMNKKNIIYSKEIVLKPAIIKNIFKINILNNKNKIEPQFQFYSIPMDGIKDWDNLEISFYNNEMTQGSLFIGNITYATSYPKIE